MRSSKIDKRVKFDKDWIKANAPKIAQLGLSGLSLYEMLVEIGISKDTYYRLIYKDEDMSNADQRFRDNAKAYWDRVCGNMAIEGKGNFKALEFIYKNRFGWKDTQIIEGNGMDHIASQNLIKVEFVNSNEKKNSDKLALTHNA